MSDKLFSIGFSGGINEAVDETLISNSQFIKACNVNIERGAIDGVVTSTAVNQTLNSLSGGFIATYYNNHTLYYITAEETGTGTGRYYLKAYNSSFVLVATSSMQSTSNYFSYINYNVDSQDVIILVNGYDVAVKYDGTSFSYLKKNGKNSTPGDGNYAPPGGSIELHYERIWIADDDTLYGSAAFDPEDFTTPTDEVEVNQHGVEISMYTNDGTKVIGLEVIFDDIIIFKEKSIWKIFGQTPANYTKIKLFTSSGSIARKSIVTGNEGAYFLASDGIYLYDGTNVRLISHAITDTLRNLNKNYVSKAVGVYYDNKYILTVPLNHTGTSGYNNAVIVYNTLTKTFMFYSYVGICDFALTSNGLISLTSDGTATTVKSFPYVNTNNSSPLTATNVGNFYLETGTMDLGTPNAIKEIDRIYITAKSKVANNTMIIRCISEYGTKEKTITLTNTSLNTYKTFSINFNARGRLLKFVITNVGASGVTFGNAGDLVISKIDFSLDLDLD